MPNIWTHIKFAEAATQATHIEIGETKAPFLNLGAQGPDPFFYHNFWPWKKEKPVAEMGSALHNTHCGPFLLDMIQEGVHDASPNKRAYIIGFVTHHLLDRNAHPYINYRSGPTAGKHQRLEVMIDTLLMNKHHGIKTWREPVYKRLSVGKELDPEINEFMLALINRHYPEEASRMPADYVNQAYRDMVLAQRLLFDRLGWKIKLLGDVVAPYTYTRQIPDVDILNEARTPWIHPTDDTETHNESLYELIEQAMAEANTLLPLMQHYWEAPSQEKLDNIEETLGNRSYETGKDCTLPHENRFFEPII